MQLIALSVISILVVNNSVHYYVGCSAPKSFILYNDEPISYQVGCTVGVDGPSADCADCKIHNHYKDMGLSRYVSAGHLEGELTISEIDPLELEMEQADGSYESLSGGSLTLQFEGADRSTSGGRLSDYYTVDHQHRPKKMVRRTYASYGSHIQSGEIKLSDGTTVAIDDCEDRPECAMFIDEMEALWIANQDSTTDICEIHLGDDNAPGRQATLKVGRVEMWTKDTSDASLSFRIRRKPSWSHHKIGGVKGTVTMKVSRNVSLMSKTVLQITDFALERFSFKDPFGKLRRTDDDTLRFDEADMTSEAVQSAYTVQTTAETLLPFTKTGDGSFTSTGSFKFVVQPTGMQSITWKKTDGSPEVHELTDGDTLEAHFTRLFTHPDIESSDETLCRKSGMHPDVRYTCPPVCLCSDDCNTDSNSLDFGCGGRNYGVMTSLKYTHSGTDYEVVNVDDDEFTYLTVDRPSDENSLFANAVGEEALQSELSEEEFEMLFEFQFNYMGG